LAIIVGIISNHAHTCSCNTEKRVW